MFIIICIEAGIKWYYTETNGLFDLTLDREKAEVVHEDAVDWVTRYLKTGWSGQYMAVSI